MYLVNFIPALVALFPLAQAFPSNIVEQLAKSPEIQARADAILKARGASSNENGDAPALPETFSEKQLIDVTGKHAWQAPGPDDARGPCPGLNAFANHGFLPHNGYATIDQFIDVTTNIIGMGPIFATFLAIYGAAIDGSGTAWSIGGHPSASLGLNNLGLGTGNGLIGSHNKYEGDASPTRPDLYQSGNNWKSQPAKFQQLLDLGGDPSVANFNIPLITTFRIQRFDEQINSNPYFFNGAFSGLAVSPAAYTFIYRFMANHSAEAPYGILNTEVLKSWFSYTGESGNLTYTPGHERIPDNWYRRDFLQPYEVDYFGLDVLYQATKYPKFLDLGGNTNGPNTFTGVSVSNLTGGLFSAANLLRGNNLACFAYQTALQAEPDVSLLGISDLVGALGKITSKLACPQLTQYDDAALQSYPGYKRKA